MAAQLTEINKPFRPDSLWSALATSSLPVPVSPRTKTVVFTFATIFMSRFSSLQGLLAPTIKSSIIAITISLPVIFLNSTKPQSHIFVKILNVSSCVFLMSSQYHCYSGLKHLANIRV